MMHMICTGRKVFWYVIPWGWEKTSDIPWFIIRIFIHGPEPMEGFGLGFLSGISIHTLESPGIPRSRYAQIPSTDDLQQRSTTTQVAPWRTEKNPQVECWTVEVIFFNSLITFFLTLLGFGSIRSLSMRCTWNSLINLENKNKDSESESFFRKKCKNLPWEEMFHRLSGRHIHFVGVGRRCLVLRNQRFNAGVNKNDRCPQGQSYSVNQQRGCWDGMTWWLTKIACYHKRHRWWFVGEKNNLFNRWDEEFS